ncbi:hypothetical protein DVH24_017037 [Malus domestica]|uniref:Uncharacterized protein n=1 Tax=Malus domestica TaxID=3750 RepID=A0A498IV42_MALDO|nr:hypothetical protein DVH24_017037 [Malus domestica]
MAILKHRSQTAADRSCVHCPRLYNVIRSLNFVCFVANLSASLAASAATSVILAASIWLNLVSQHAVVIPDHSLFFDGASLGSLADCSGNAGFASVGSHDITAAEEETVDGVVWGFDGGVVEARGAVGVGGEGGEEAVEVGLEGGVWGEGGGV